VEAEQQANRRRLAGAVRAEIPVDLARRDGQIEAVERERRAVALRQPLRFDRRRRSPSSPANASHAITPRLSRPERHRAAPSARPVVLRSRLAPSGGRRLDCEELRSPLVMQRHRGR
jgi:hypothetical protein